MRLCPALHGRKSGYALSKNISTRGPRNCRSLHFGRDDKGRVALSLRAIAVGSKGGFHPLGCGIVREEALRYDDCVRLSHPGSTNVPIGTPGGETATGTRGTIGRDDEPWRCYCSCASKETRLQPHRRQLHHRRGTGARRSRVVSVSRAARNHAQPAAAARWTRHPRHDFVVCPHSRQRLFDL